MPAGSASRAVLRSSQRHPLELAISSEGVSIRLLSEPKLSYDSDVMNKIWLSAVRDKWEFLMPRKAREQADGLFTVFCLSSLRLKLAKCRRSQCGRYFELKHWNRSYQRGTFCPECNANRSALECTKRKREWEHATKSPAPPKRSGSGSENQNGVEREQSGKNAFASGIPISLRSR